MSQETITYRVGEPIEAAAWFTNPISRIEASKLIHRAFWRAEAEHLIVFGPLRLYELTPDDRRCPAIPVDSPHDMRLLVGEADVKSIKPRPEKSDMAPWARKATVSKPRPMPRCWR